MSSNSGEHFLHFTSHKIGTTLFIETAQIELLQFAVQKTVLFSLLLLK